MSKDEITKFHEMLHLKCGIIDFSGPRMIQYGEKAHYSADKEAVAQMFTISAFTEEEIKCIESVARELKKDVIKAGNSLSVLFPV